MTPVRIAQLLGRLLALLVLVASGAYFIVYLYRWEWNRAQISGLIFVATELTVVGSLILRRLRVIESRVVRAETWVGDGPGAQGPGATQPGGTNAGDGGGPTPSSRFRWLDPSRTSVFIPVLLGAGAVLSALAYVIERIAGFVVGEHPTRPAPLAGIAYPPGGLLSDGPGEASPGSPPGRLPRWARAVIVTIAIAIGALVIGAAVDVLADATQSRPEASENAGTSEVTVRIGYRSADPTPIESTAQALFESCRLRLPADARLVTAPRIVGPRTVSVTIEPALGTLGIRRLGGCLEDYTLDGVLAELVSVHRQP